LVVEAFPLLLIYWSENDSEVVALDGIEVLAFHKLKSLEVRLYCNHPLGKEVVLE